MCHHRDLQHPVDFLGKRAVLLSGDIGRTREGLVPHIGGGSPIHSQLWRNATILRNAPEMPLCCGQESINGSHQIVAFDIFRCNGVMGSRTSNATTEMPTGSRHSQADRDLNLEEDQQGVLSMSE